MNGRLKRVLRLMRLREHAESLARGRLAVHLGESEERRRAVAEQRDQIHDISQQMSVDLSTGLQASRLSLQLSYLDLRIRGLARSVSRLNEQAPLVEQARVELRERRRERQILERWSGRLRSDLQREEAKREQKILDELGVREALERLRHQADEVY